MVNTDVRDLNRELTEVLGAAALPHQVLDPTSRAHSLAVRDAVARLEKLRGSPESCFREAAENLPELLEVEAAAERLDVSFAKVSVLAGGHTVAGDPLDVSRASVLARMARSIIFKKQSPRLAAVGANGLVVDDPDLSGPQRALGFLVAALSAGADPVLSRYKANAYLLAEGYPWLAPDFDDVDEYRRGLSLATYGFDPDVLLETLVNGAQERRKRSEQNWWWPGDQPIRNQGALPS